MDEICFVTGHRPNKIGGFDKMGRLIELAIAVIRKHEPRLIYTGMALGWDQAVARACTILGVPFIAAVPFSGQEEAWPVKSRVEYQDLLTHAVEVVVVCEGGYAPEKMQRRNVYMVDHSTFGLALWNGTSGGTCNCLKYADSQHKPNINVWSSWLKYR